MEYAAMPFSDSGALGMYSSHHQHMHQQSAAYPGLSPGHAGATQHHPGYPLHHTGHQTAMYTRHVEPVDPRFQHSWYEPTHSLTC